MTSELVTASIMNIHVRDNLSFLRAIPANRCEAYHNATQTIPGDDTAALNLNSEVIDTAAMHDNVTNNERITVPSGGGGTYLAVGMSRVDASSSGTYELQLRVNGTAIRRATNNLNSIITMNVHAIVPMAAGDYFELAGITTGNARVYGSATAALATRMEVIGPLPPS